MNLHVSLEGDTSSLASLKEFLLKHSPTSKPLKGTSGRQGVLKQKPRVIKTEPFGE